MVTSKEKLEFISSIISTPSDELDSNEVQKRLHELLLCDTTDGKLYKYRSFDSNGYALKNLEDGTLHFSAPNAFNDPFDCKIGITFKSLFEAKYGAELELIFHFWDKFMFVVHSEISIDECNENEKRIILKLMNNNRLMRFVQEEYSRLLTEEARALFLRENIHIVLEFAETVLAEHNIASSLGICSSVIPQLKNVSKDGILQLSKEESTIQDFAVANGINKDADEIELMMLLIDKINPQYSSSAADIKMTIDDLEHRVGGTMAKLFLVGCLCTSYKNRLMWSHYADSHKGFCVEYDFSTPSAEVLSIMPLPVIYSQTRPLIPWGAALENSPENIEDASRQLMIGLLTKDDAWSYENEWRILTTSTDFPEMRMPRISCIYLGACINEDNRNKILEIARKNYIPVKQMKVDRGEYELHAQEVLTFDKA